MAPRKAPGESCVGSAPGGGGGRRLEGGRANKHPLVIGERRQFTETTPLIYEGYHTPKRKHG